MVKHVVKQNKIVFVFASPYEPGNVEFGAHMEKHGDGAKDVSFQVEDLDVIVKVGASISFQAQVYK